MHRSFQFAGLLAIVAITAPAADQKAAAKAPDAKPPVVRPVIPRKGAAKGPPITNPASPASRLYRATPEERERALEKLPVRQQERIRKNLEWFDALAKQDQAIILKRAERYESMTPEARQAFNQQFRALAQLPQERRQAVASVLRRLQTMTDEQRAAVLASDAFRNRFSPEEQRLIVDLSQVIPSM